MPLMAPILTINAILRDMTRGRDDLQGPGGRSRGPVGPGDQFRGGVVAWDFVSGAITVD